MLESGYPFLDRGFRLFSDILEAGGDISPSALAVGVAGAAIVGTAIYFLTRSTKPFQINFDRNRISKRLGVDDHGAEIRVSLFCDADDQLRRVAFDECKTLHDCFKRGMRVSEDGPCLGWRPTPGSRYEWISFSEVESRANAFGAGILALGIELHSAGGEPHTGFNQELIGIYSQNNKEWLIAAQGAWAYSMCAVPLYDTLGPRACTFIINQGLISIVLCDTTEKVQSLLNRREETPSLRHVILIIPTEVATMKALKALAASAQIVLHSFDEILASGRANPRPIRPPKPDDVALVCYTSGTTGDPKGALLTHGNYTATVAGLEKHVQQLRLGPSDVVFSYLPLAHTFEQVSTSILLAFGSSIGFFQGDMKLLMDDMAELKPTIFPTVPRLLNRMYDNVQAKARVSKLKSILFDLALKRKTFEIERGIVRKTSIWDRLVFNKVHATMGGRVRAIFCGSAPLEPNVMRFVRCVTGAVVVEGYGQTECAAVASCQLPGEITVGQVGAPLPCTRIKLADVPDMGLLAKDGKGEVCLKGPNVFQGYLKDPVKTAEALDPDGWLHTGDIGVWNSNGAVSLVDRKKHIFKLAQGEYIAPEKIEGIFSQSCFVAQIFIHGESYKSCLVAFIVPNQPEIENWANKNGIEGVTYEALLANERVKKGVMEDVNKLGRQAGLKSFELVKDIKLCAEPWTVEAGLLTPTFKTKRPQLKILMQAEIADMYSRLW